MMKKTTILSGLVFLLVLVATTAGVFYTSPGSPINYLTIRGEQAVFQGSGLYRYDPSSFAREGVIWDVINLFFGLPLFALAIFLNQRNSLRGQLFIGGLLFYLSYVYGMAMTGYSFNRLFLVYVAILALSAVTFFINLSEIDVEHLPDKVTSRFPRHLFIGFTFVMGAALIILWLGRIIPVMINNKLPSDMAGMTTLITQGFDLGMIVPLLFSTGILLWRRSPWGYLLTSISLCYGLMMCIAIPAWIAVPLIQNGNINPVEAVPFLVLCLVGLILAGLFYGNVKQEKIRQ